MSTITQSADKSKKKTSSPIEADNDATLPGLEKADEQDKADGTESMTNESKAKPLDPIVALEEQLTAAQEEAKSSYDRFLRVSAEFENYKKRILRETSESKKFANETLLKELLSVVDNLERALNASKEDDTAAEGLIDGVEMTLKALLKIFEKFAVKPIEAQGKPFDPTYHQAMGQEKTDAHPENTVILEFQKGYTYHDRLLRPAMVIVAKPDNDDET